jgi:endo-1,4-beta-xylanase
MELRKLAAEKGVIYGTAISAASIASDPEFVDLVLRQAGAVVAENDMKWQAMNCGKPGNDNYGPADTVAGFALESGLVLRGHNLLWYRSAPPWFFDLPTKREMEGAIVAHIRSSGGPLSRTGSQLGCRERADRTREQEAGRPSHCCFSRQDGAGLYRSRLSYRSGG